MNEQQTAKLLRLREIRLERARKARAQTARAVRHAERQRKLAEDVLDAFERQREQTKSEAYARMMNQGQSALGFERLNHDLTRLAEDCSMAADEARTKAERLKDCRAADRESLTAVRRAEAERQAWSSLHNRACGIGRRTEQRRLDHEDEAVLEQRMAGRA